MHKNILWKKGLVVGIIVLFIGVAIAPSINAGITVKRDTIQDIQETVESSVVETSDSENDCNCQDISKSDVYRIERLLTRLEFIVKIISIKFRNNPEIKEKCQELLDVIPELSIMMDKSTSYQSNDDTPYFLCAMLASAVLTFYLLTVYFGKLVEKYENNTILYTLFYSIGKYCYDMGIYLAALFTVICWYPERTLNNNLESDYNNDCEIADILFERFPLLNLLLQRLRI